MEQVYCLPKYYANYNREAPRETNNYDQLNINWNSVDDFAVFRKIGRGKYSDVFEAINNKTSTMCVIKILKPVKKKKIFREIKILQNLQGGPNIINLIDLIRDDQTKTPCLVFEHINNTDYKTLYPSFSDFDIRFYIYQILQALDYSHQHGIIHRDIKPQNVVIDHERRVLKVIDWGLGEFYYPGRPLNVRVASRYYKGPELLVDDQHYYYALDIWSLGAMLASMVSYNQIFKRDPFFHGQDNNDQLVKIARILGTEELFQYLEKYNITLASHFDGVIGRFPKIPWQRFINQNNQHLATDEAVDFLSKCLLYDHAERITPLEAIQHPYIQPVVQMYEKLQTGNIPYAPNTPEYTTAHILLNNR